jgi:AraC family transcriptional regulator of adaptative response / DNA-3-methyladenine glycosylase II
VRLAVRRPFAAASLFSFLGARTVAGVEAHDGATYRRSLRLPHGDGTVELVPDDGHVRALFRLGDLRDLTAAIARCRHLCNLDADPEAVDAALGADEALRGLVRAVPGLRVPGSVDGFETAVRAVLGQQVSVAGARTVAARVVAVAGRPLADDPGGLTRVFPGPQELAELVARRPETLPVPATRRRALGALAEACATGRLAIDPGAAPEELSAALCALPGIGPWTAAYVAMRALGDPDAFLPTDLGSRRAATRLCLPGDPGPLLAVAERWRPWRAYAQMHLWSTPAGAVAPKAITPTRKGEDAA